jgi:flagellar biosynthesis component FlhA
MNLLAWYALLVVQTAAFTWVSRARNSGSIGYHALASVFSNGIFFVSQYILIGMAAKPGMPFWEAAKLGVIYIAGTVTGAVLMHYAALRWLEKGKRKVGA